MLRIIKIVLFLLITIAVHVSAEKYLYPVVDGTSVGYIDSTGTVAIKIDYFPQFEYVNKRLAGVTVKTFVLPRNAYFSDGFAFTRKPYRWLFLHLWSSNRLIDTEGELYDIGSEDYQIGRFVDGMAPIQLAEKYGNFRLGTYFGFVDKAGNIINGANNFDYASEFKDSLSLVRFMDLYGFVNKNGTYRISPQFTNAEPFSEGLASATTDSIWGYIDKNGKFVIKPQFAVTWKFTEGFARVMKDAGSLLYFIDKKGNRIGKLSFADCSDFSEGMAAAQFDGKYGFIDTTGNFSIKPQFLYAGEFHNGLAPAASEFGWGFIDHKGNWAIKPDYTYVEAFDHKLALAWKNGDLYYINSKGVRVYQFVDFKDE